MSEYRSQHSSFIERHIGLVITSLISIATVSIAGFQAIRDGKAANRAAEVAEARANREFDMRTYEMVISAIEKNNTRIQVAALSLISLVKDSSVRAGLAEALDKGGTKETQKVVFYETEEREVKVNDQKSLTSPGTWRYDVFSCEGVRESPRYSLLSVYSVTKEFGRDNVRLRELPALINSRPGYNVTGYQIRYEKSEQAEMTKLRDFLRTRLGIDFKPVVVSNKTPKYLSLFVCPD